MLKMYHCFDKNFSSTTVFKIDNNNNKCFLSRKSSYQNDYSRIMWHWRHE